MVFLARYRVAALAHAATSGLAKPGRPSSPLGQRLDNTLETGLSATEGGPRTAIALILGRMVWSLAKQTDE